MKIKNDISRNRTAGLLVHFCIACMMLSVPLIAGSDTVVKYTDSAHGSSVYGVQRTSITGYARGLCIHCHESHGSLDGEEPAPNEPAGPDKHLLLSQGFDPVDNLRNVCLECHTRAIDSYQSGGTLANRTYSFRAGGYSSGFDGAALSIKEMLDPAGATPPLSTHDMLKIQDVIRTRWNYTDDSNPCTACHNPHKAKGDPADNPTGQKTEASRGWPLSRPSQHFSAKDNSYLQWQIWGDDAAERMDAAYPVQYTDPYRPGNATYEPDGSVIQRNGAALTDTVALCQDCHNAAVPITSDELPSPLRAIDWAQEKHGAGNADGALNIKSPYANTPGSQVLSCMDCHEPHGAGNTTLLRGGVNGAALANTIQLNPMSSDQCTTPSAGSPYSNNEMAALCIRCHQDDTAFAGVDSDCAGQSNRYYIIHHDSNSGEAPPYPFPANNTCTNCHGGGSGTGCNSAWTPINCTCCHYHDASSEGRRTF